MTTEWTIDEPKTIDLNESETAITAVQIGIIAGRIDIVCHDDHRGAHLEVHDIEGRPLTVGVVDGTLHVNHLRWPGPDAGSWWDRLKSAGEGLEKARAHVSLSVHRSTRVEIGTVSGEAVVSGSHAAVTVRTVSGDATVEKVVGETRLDTVSGSLDVRALTGTLRAQSVSGPVTADSCHLDRAELTTVSGDLVIDLHSDSAELRSSSVSGDVTVRIPSGAGYDADARTVSGHALLDGQSFGGMPGQRGGHRTDGDGAIILRASSLSGNVVLLRATVPAGEAQRLPTR